LALAVVVLAVTFLAFSLALDPTLGSTLRVAFRGSTPPKSGAS
jgi:hypothetical protein